MSRYILPLPSVFTDGQTVTTQTISKVEDVVEDGLLTVKLLMVGTDMVCLEAFKEKGMIDPVHVHEDHESIAYLLSGKLKLRIGDEEFIANPGDVWRHPRGVPHLSEALEDSVQLEFKSPPRKTWTADDEG